MRGLQIVEEKKAAGDVYLEFYVIANVKMKETFMGILKELIRLRKALYTFIIKS